MGAVVTTIGLQARLIRTWQPLVGKSYARSISRAWAPAEAFLVVLPLWWAVGIAHSVLGGPARVVLGNLNAAFGAVIIGILALVPWLLHRVKGSIRRNLRDRGFTVEHSPPLVSTRAFREWLGREQLDAADVQEMLDLPYRP